MSTAAPSPSAERALSAMAGGCGPLGTIMTIFTMTIPMRGASG